MNVGQRISTRRKELGLSADKVAAYLKKDRSTIYRYESNEIEKLPTSVLEPLAKVLQTTPAYLMGWTNNPHEDENGKSGRTDEITPKPDSVELENDVIIYNRNGKIVKRKMSKEKMDMLASMIDAIPEDNNPDL